MTYLTHLEWLGIPEKGKIVTDWGTDRQTNWRTDRKTNWRKNWRTDQQTIRSTNLQTNGPTDWLSEKKMRIFEHGTDENNVPEAWLKERLINLWKKSWWAFGQRKNIRSNPFFSLNFFLIIISFPFFFHHLMCFNSFDSRSDLILFGQRPQRNDVREDTGVNY